MSVRSLVILMAFATVVSFLGTVFLIPRIGRGWSLLASAIIGVFLGVGLSVWDRRSGKRGWFS